MQLIAVILTCCAISATCSASPFDSLAADTEKMMKDLADIQKQLDEAGAKEADDDKSRNEVETLDPDADLKMMMMKDLQLSEDKPLNSGDKVKTQDKNSPKPINVGMKNQARKPHNKNSNPFSATINCKSEYQLGEDVYCQFDITNNDKVDYHLLKRNTPLEGMRSHYLTVTQGGRPVYYDGILLHRNQLTENEYILVKAGQTVSAKVDLSLAYAMNTTGRYEVKLDAPIRYHEYTQERCEVQSEIVDTHKEEYATRMETNPTFFQLSGLNNPKKTMGQYFRKLSKAHSHEGTTEQAGVIRDPFVYGGTADQHAKVKEIHRAMYYYLTAALEDVDDNPDHYIKWFGERSDEYIDIVKSNLQKMIDAMSEEYTYRLDCEDCTGRAYITFGTTLTCLCPSTWNNPLSPFNPVPDILGDRTKLCTFVHEFAHTIASVNRFESGALIPEHYFMGPAMILASTNPWHAANNAENYCYFIESVNVFDYGRDSMALFPSGNGFNLYMTRGNMFLKYKDDSKLTVDDGFPMLIRGNWHNLREDFYEGFDSMVDFNGNVYITKGSEYICYTCLDRTPRTLQGNFGSSQLPYVFENGFDAAVAVKDYNNNFQRIVTKGPNYISVDGPAGILPFTNVIPGDWGNTPPEFNAGFDSMVRLGNGKLYVTKGKNYIRYTNGWDHSTIDSTYPRPIRGYWGTVNFPGHSEEV